MTAPIAGAATGRRLVILLILLVAFGLRCGGLDAQELRGDEAFGYFFSLPDFDVIVHETLALNEPHPVASYWLQHLWLGVTGHSEFALRFLGVWWGVLAVALMVTLATHLELSTLVSSVAAALMALSPYAIWHSQDARMYSMSLALTLASTVLAVCWWQSSTRSRLLWCALGYVLVTWLALHTHYFALYVVVAQQVAIGGWAIWARAWRKLLIWWGLGLLVLLLWVPWLIAAWSILFGYGGNGDSPSLMDALVRAHSAFVVSETVPSALQWWWATLAVVAVALGAMSLWRMPSKRGRSALWLLVIYWLTPLLATWLSAQSRPIFNERYLVAAVPPVYLLMAAAMGGRQGDAWLRWLGRVAVALVMVAMTMGLVRQVSDPTYSKTRGWRELAVALDALAAGVDPASVRLVQNYPDPTLWYYYQGAVAHLVLPPAPHDATRSDEEVTRMVADEVTRVVLVEQPSDSWDADAVAREALGAQFSLVNTATVARWPLSIWLRPQVVLEPMDVDYESGLHLGGARILPTVVSPGGLVEVHLHWQGSVGEQEAVSVQLLNGNGELVAQSDRPLGMASLTTDEIVSYGILLPNELASGDYQLAVVVYDPGQAGAPRRMNLQGADSLLLGTVTVVGK